jgi:hydrogenase nickel incorporation protein HypA/HybF
MGIVELAESQAREHHAESISRINLEIGTLAGIEFDSLDFAWEVGVKDTLLENAERVIDKIQAKAKCLECHTQFDILHLYDDCPQCHSYFNQILCGKELRVKSLIIN